LPVSAELCGQPRRNHLTTHSSHYEATALRLPP